MYVNTGSSAMYARQTLISDRCNSVKLLRQLLPGESRSRAAAKQGSVLHDAAAALAAKPESEGGRALFAGTRTRTELHVLAHARPVGGVRQNVLDRAHFTQVCRTKEAVFRAQQAAGVCMPAEVAKPRPLFHLPAGGSKPTAGLEGNSSSVDATGPTPATPSSPRSRGTAEDCMQPFSLLSVHNVLESLGYGQPVDALIKLSTVSSTNLQAVKLVCKQPAALRGKLLCGNSLVPCDAEGCRAAAGRPLVCTIQGVAPCDIVTKLSPSLAELHTFSTLPKEPLDSRGCDSIDWAGLESTLNVARVILTWADRAPEFSAFALAVNALVDTQFLLTNQSSVTRVLFALPNGSPADDVDALAFAYTASALVAQRSSGDTEFTWRSWIYFDDYANRAFLRDVAWALGALSFLLLYTWTQMGSVLMTLVSVTGVLAAFPLTLNIYAWVFGIRWVGVLHFLGIFIILGIGADDIFVLLEHWKLSKLDGAESTEERMAWTLHHSLSAISATTFTTIAAFAANMVSSIAPVRLFGLFMVILCTVNFVFLLVLVPTLLVLYQQDPWGPWHWGSRASAMLRKRLKMRQTFDDVGGSYEAPLSQCGLELAHVNNHSHPLSLAGSCASPHNLATPTSAHTVGLRSPSFRGAVHKRQFSLPGMDVTTAGPPGGPQGGVIGLMSLGSQASFHIQSFPGETIGDYTLSASRSVSVGPKPGRDSALAPIENGESGRGGPLDASLSGLSSPGSMARAGSVNARWHMMGGGVPEAMYGRMSQMGLERAWERQEGSVIDGDLDTHGSLSGDAHGMGHRLAACGRLRCPMPDGNAPSMAHALLEKQITGAIIRCRWLVLVLAGALTLFFAIRASMLKLPEGRPTVWKEQSNMVRYYAMETEFEFGRMAEKISLDLVWGVQPQDTGFIITPYELGELVLQPDARWMSGESQLWLLNLCRKLQAVDTHEIATGSIQCPMEVVSKYLALQGRELPIPEEEFSQFIQSISQVKGLASEGLQGKVRFGTPGMLEDTYIYDSHSHYLHPDLHPSAHAQAPQAASEPGRAAVDIDAPRGWEFGSDAGEGRRPPVHWGEDVALPLTHAISFTLNETWTQPFRDVKRIWQKWEDWLSAELAAPDAPKELQSAFQTAGAWQIMELREVMFTSGKSSLLLSLALASGTLTIVTGNVLVAMLASGCICCVVAVFLGSMQLLGWTMGIIESVCVAVMVGLSVDYIVHMATCFSQCALPSCRERIAYTLRTVGMSVMSGAITTIGASAFLLPCEMAAFQKFGVIECITLVTALFFALVVFPALCAVFGLRDYRTGRISVLLQGDVWVFLGRGEQRGEGAVYAPLSRVASEDELPGGAEAADLGTSPRGGKLSAGDGEDADGIPTGTALHALRT